MGGGAVFEAVFFFEKGIGLKKTLDYIITLTYTALIQKIQFVSLLEQIL